MYFQGKQDRQAGHNVGIIWIRMLKSEHVIMNLSSVLLKAEDWLMGGCQYIIYYCVYL